MILCIDQLLVSVLLVTQCEDAFTKRAPSVRSPVSMCSTPASADPVHGKHRVQQNLCNQPTGQSMDTYQRELAAGGALEELVQEAAYS